jgi:hypothetical protein
VLKEDYVRKGAEFAEFIKPLEPFNSPIDGSIISCRSQLRAHNEKHGVTNMADYSEECMKSNKHKRESAGQRELKESRVQDLHKAFQQFR